MIPIINVFNLYEANNLIRQHRSYQDADEVNSGDNPPWNKNELVDSELVERDTQRASTIPMYP